MKDMNGISIEEGDWITDGYGFGKVKRIYPKDLQAIVDWSDEDEKDEETLLLFCDCDDITVVKNRQQVLNEIASQQWIY